MTGTNIQLYVNGRALQPDQYRIHLTSRIPIQRPKWKRYLSWLIPAFRQQYRESKVLYVELLVPVGSGDKIVMRYEAEAMIGGEP